MFLLSLLSFIDLFFFFFFSSRRRHTRSDRDWSSDVCSSDLLGFSRPATTRTRAASSTGRISGRKSKATRRSYSPSSKRAAKPNSRRTEIRSEERREGKSVDLGGRRIIKKKKKKKNYTVNKDN